MSKIHYKIRDRGALVDLMDFRDVTVRELAAKVKCSRATIGHLRTGEREFVRREWAKSIEDELRAPRGSLFSPVLATVQLHTSTVVASRLRPAA